MISKERQEITHRCLVSGLIFTAFLSGKNIIGLNFVLLSLLFSLVGLTVTYVAVKKSMKSLINVLNIISDIAVFIIVLKMGIFIFNTPFVFEKLVLMFTKGIFMIIAGMSFSCRGKNIFAYITILTLLIVMSYPVLFTGLQVFFKLSIGLYIFFWILFLRFSCQNFSIGNRGQTFIAVFSCFVFLILSLFLTDFFGKNIVFPKIHYNYSFILTQRFAAEDKLYLLQDSFLAEGMGVNISNDRRRDIFIFLPKMFKESPWIMEVEKARSGLVSLLQRPGPGIEESKRQVLFRLLKEYTTAKIEMKKAKIASELIEEVSNSSVSSKGKFSVSLKTNSLYRSKNLQDVEDNANSLKETISEYTPEKQKEEKLTELADRLEKWSIYSVYDNSRSNLEPELLSKMQELLEDDHSADHEVENLRRDIEKSEGISELMEVSKEVENLDDSDSGVKDDSQSELENMVNGKMDILLIEESEKLPSANNEEESTPDDSSLNNDQSFDVNSMLPDEVELKYVKVKPKSAEVSLGNSFQFEATAYFSDESYLDVTTEADWESSALDKGDVDKGRLVTFREGETTVSAYWNKKESNPAYVAITAPKLTAISVKPLFINFPRGEPFSLIANGYYTNGSRKDITGSVEWQISGNVSTFEQGKGTFIGDKVGKAQIYAEDQDIQSNSVQVNIFIPVWVVVKTGLLFFLSLIILILSLVYIKIRIKSAQLRGLISKDHSKLIIAVYENMLSVLTVFGVKYNKAIPYLRYALMVGERFDFSRDSFLILSRKFSEVKYSSHKVTSKDAITFLKSANSLMNAIRNQVSYRRRFFLFLKSLPTAV